MLLTRRNTTEWARAESAVAWFSLGLLCSCGRVDYEGTGTSADNSKAEAGGETALRVSAARDSGPEDSLDGGVEPPLSNPPDAGTGSSDVSPMQSTPATATTADSSVRVPQVDAGSDVSPTTPADSPIDAGVETPTPTDPPSPDAAGPSEPPPECGDGVIDAPQGETCDDSGESATCDVDCTAAACGDGVVNSTAGEECEPTIDLYCLADCTRSHLSLLAHRYSFNGTGTLATDSIGSADGTVQGGASLSGTGNVVLAGTTSEQFVDLPNGIASALTDATFEVWLVWDGGADWQRIFDFGSSDAGEGAQGAGVSYINISPQASGVMRSAFRAPSATSAITLNATRALPIGLQTHVALVFDDTNDLMSLYVNGSFDASIAMGEHLSSLDDVNNWLGRTQWNANPELSASMTEFRIYTAALSAGQINENYTRGPNQFSCGDGVIDVPLGEECDDAGASATCSATCTTL